jgi:hypothetical protein
MSHIYSHRQTTSTTPAAATVAASLADARKLANKERRQAGREVRQSSPHQSLLTLTLWYSLPQRHEERKQELKAHEFDRKWERHDRDAQRQEKRREDGTRAFTGRNLYNHRKAGASHVRGATDTITAPTPTPTPTALAAAEDQHRHQPEDEEGYYNTEEEEVRFAEEQQATSGAMLLAMARPAKTRSRRQQRGYCPPVMTDGETFEVVEIDGRLVALDEDGWEILPDENAEVSLLYSDIVRGTAL